MTAASFERTSSTESKENPFRKYLSTLCNVGLVCALTLGGGAAGEKWAGSQVENYSDKPLTTEQIYKATESDWAKNNPHSSTSTNPEVAKKLHKQHNNTFTAAAKQANSLEAGKLATLKGMSEKQKESPAIKSAIDDLKEIVSQNKSDKISLKTLYENEKKESSFVGGLLGGMAGLVTSLALLKSGLLNKLDKQLKPQNSNKIKISKEVTALFKVSDETINLPAAPTDKIEGLEHLYKNSREITKKNNTVERLEKIYNQSNSGDNLI